MTVDLDVDIYIRIMSEKRSVFVVLDHIQSIVTFPKLSG
jgi:hypothetical protein